MGVVGGLTAFTGCQGLCSQSHGYVDTGQIMEAACAMRSWVEPRVSPQTSRPSGTQQVLSTCVDEGLHIGNDHGHIRCGDAMGLGLFCG